MTGEGARDTDTAAVAPDRRRLIVTIDGPAGVGKSSVARAAAARLGLDFLDTGSMYRAATAVAIDHGVDLTDERAVAELAERAALVFDWDADPPELLAFDRPIGHRLRDADVDANVSAVSGLAALREVMVRLQRAIGRRHPRLLSEGRDQGSVVFPDADVRIYLDASIESRTERRAQQLEALGRTVDREQLAREIAERDHRDSTRKVGPLTRPKGAIEIDTSDMSFDGSVGAIVQAVRDSVPFDLTELASCARGG